MSQILHKPSHSDQCIIKIFTTTSTLRSRFSSSFSGEDFIAKATVGLARCLLDVETVFGGLEICDAGGEIGGDDFRLIFVVA